MYGDWNLMTYAFQQNVMLRFNLKYRPANPMDHDDLETDDKVAPNVGLRGLNPILLKLLKRIKICIYDVHNRITNPAYANAFKNKHPLYL